MRRALAKSLGAVEERFVIQIKTDNAGSSADNQFTVPTRFGGYNYTIETSDGQTINNVTGNYTITFPSPGIYDIMISGDFPWYRGIYSPDPQKLIDIKNWGTNAWNSFDSAFNGSSLTTVTATDIPNLESVLNIQGMFANTPNLLSVPNIENWDVSNITSIRATFNNCGLFYNTNPNSPDLSNWDTSNISDFSYAFYNGNNTGAKVDFDMSGWNIENMVAGTDFITGYKTNSLSTANYDSTLISWASQNVNSNVSINFGNAQYTLGGAAEAARNTLINTYGWTITDGGGI